MLACRAHPKSFCELRNRLYGFKFIKINEAPKNQITQFAASANESNLYKSEENEEGITMVILLLDHVENGASSILGL